MNGVDPEGLSVQRLFLKESDSPTCFSSRFFSNIWPDPNFWLNTDYGMLALQVWFEADFARDTEAARNMWRGIGNVYRNRWKLSQADKVKYRSLLGDPKQSFGRMIYNASAAADRHFDSNLRLKPNETNKLINILNGDPDTEQCKAMISAFDIASDVWHDIGSDNTGGALQYVHVWWPSNPFGVNISNLINPFGGPITPQITYATGFMYYGPVRGIDRSVSTFFYRPGF